MKKQKQSTALVVQKKALPKAKVIRRNKSDEVIAMVMEEVETKLIEAELAGKVVDKLAYQVFDDKGNLLMQDLTYIGIRELSRRNTKNSSSASPLSLTKHRPAVVNDTNF